MRAIRGAVARGVLALLFIAGSEWQATAAEELARAIPAKDLKSGRAFLAPETKAQQDDLSVNPGMLWVEQGLKLWNAPEPATAKACASCHGVPQSLKSVAARYPRIDAATGRLLNLELRINQCRSERQGGAAFAYESEELLALTALLAHQSRGEPLHVEIDHLARPRLPLDRGQAACRRDAGRLGM